jgi:single-stranded DNA-binding protein
MNKIQIYGFLGDAPEIRIKKSGSMMASLLIESRSSWQAALGEWNVSTQWHHVVVYNEPVILWLDEHLKKGKLRIGDYLFVQGTLNYKDGNEESAVKKRKTQIVVSRKTGLIFQLLENTDLIKRKLPLFYISETEHENKSPQNPQQTQ